MFVFGRVSGDIILEKQIILNFNCIVRKEKKIVVEH